MNLKLIAPAFAAALLASTSAFAQSTNGNATGSGGCDATAPNGDCIPPALDPSVEGRSSTMEAAPPVVQEPNRDQDPSQPEAELAPGGGDPSGTGASADGN